MWKILLQEFVADLRSHRKRMLLTTLAVTWGTVTVVLLLAFGEGLRRTFVNGQLGAGDRIFKIYGGTISEVHDGLPKGRDVRLREADLELLERSIPEVTFTSPSYGRNNTTLEREDVRTTTYMEGVSPAFSELRSMDPMPGGRFINRRDVEERRRVLFLGDEIAADLFGDEDPVGEQVRLDGLPFTVVGTMREKFQSSMSNGPDAERAIIPASTFRAIYGREYVSHLVVRPGSRERAPHVEREIRRILGARHAFAPSDERALPMWDFIENEELNRRIGLGIQIFLGLVGAFTLLVAGVGVANIMYVVVRERTREVGVKRALGARRGHIVMQFVSEALVVTLAGGAVGLLFSTAVVLAVDSLPVTSQAMEYILNPKLSWPIAAVAVAILTAIGLAAGVLPARRAARVDPVESLRYE
ncbi:MAG: ABC transporter permease [Gemmatimonadota bacterium]